MRALLACMLILPVAATRAGVVVQKDIPYLGTGRSETLDAYLPDEAFQRPVPAIVHIHGGGWRRGDKASRRDSGIARFMAENGYVVFSINYKLNEGYRDEKNRLHLTHVAWPQNLYDCKSAVRFARAEAARFGIDPQRIGVMGGSAGGHLAMLVGTTADEEDLNSHGLYTDQSNEVSCVIDFYGDYDMRDSKISLFTGASPKPTAADKAAASPVTYLREDLPPFFIAHGSEDKVIPVDRSRRLAWELEALGVDHVYLEMEGAPHSFGLDDEQKELQDAVLEFLRTRLGEAKQN